MSTNNKKNKITLNNSKSAAMGFFPRDSRRSLKQPVKRAISVRATEALLYMYTFACLIEGIPPLMFSDTAITNHHNETTLSSSRHTGFEFPGLLTGRN